MPESNTSTNTTTNSDDDENYTTIEITPGITLRILEDLSEDDEQDEVEDAVGRLVWPTAVPLLRHIWSENDTWNNNNKLIVELGAGCGVLGMGLVATSAAAISGTTVHHTASDDNKYCEVILTDHDADWLEQNLALNKAVLGDAAISVARLDWRNPQDIETVQNMMTEKLLSMNNNNNLDTTELWIVGSDILYNHETHRSLASTLFQLSNIQSTARIIIGFPDRDNDEEHFLPIVREFLGDKFPSSKPIETKSNKRGKSMDLRVLDVTLNN